MLLSRWLEYFGLGPSLQASFQDDTAARTPPPPLAPPRAFGIAASQAPRPVSAGAARFFEFHMTRDAEGMWRWTLLTVNGHALARSAHGYVREFECEEAMRRLLLVDAATPVIRH